MAAQIQQAVAFAINNASAAASVTINGVLQGSTLYFIVYSGGNANTTSASDGTNSYVHEDSVLDTPNGGYSIDTFVAVNVTAGSYTITGSPSNIGFPWGIVVEVSGVTTSPLDGHKASNLIIAPGSGADAITVGPPSPNNAHTPCLVVGVTAQVTNGGGSDGNETHGTGYTLFNNYNPWGGTGNSIAVESLLLNAGTSAAATFTAGGSGLALYYASVAIFDQSGTPPSGYGNAVWFDGGL